MGLTVASLLAQLELISRARPDRVLRLLGELPGPEGMEAFELVIFRGFSSSVTHPTGFEPDRPLLPEGSVLRGAELLAAPLNPAAEQRLAGPEPAERFLHEAAWL